MQRRFRYWVVVAVIAAGCAGPATDQPAVSDATDVWFMQHLVPHLRQTSSIVGLSRDRITNPELARLADTIDQQGQAHLQVLQGWLDRRGLAPHAHSHQGVDLRRRSDLDRLSQAPGPRFDLAFLEVMAARHRAGGKLAAIELAQGSLPEVRQLARQLQAEHRRQLRKMTAWRNVWSGTDRPGPA